MIYLYGLMKPDTEGAEALAADLQGVTGPVHIAHLSHALLIYGAHGDGEILAKRRYLLAHAHVLEAFLELGTVLPMRFGMIAQDVAAVSEVLSRQSDLLCQEMGRLEGLIELGVRISFDRDAALAAQLQRDPSLLAERDRLRGATAGAHFDKAEFGRKLGEALERHRTDTQKQLIRQIRAHVADFNVKTPDADVEVLNAEVLLPQSALTNFSDELASLCGQVEFGGGSEPMIRLIGPEPPYHFVKVALETAAEPA